MTITRNDRNQAWDPAGNLVADDAVTVDVTEAAIRADIHIKARQALDANATFLALASPTNPQILTQVRRLTRECSAVIRLLVAVDGFPDLLVENNDT